MISFSQLGNMGRLGNQFFQIAATIGAAKNNHQDYGLPSWPVNDYIKNPLPQTKFFDPQITHYEKFCTYDPINFDLEEGETLRADLVGYFQSEKYFSDSQNEIKYHLQPSEELSSYIEEKYGSIFEETNVASLHVRRGDYLTLRRVYASPTIEYYKKCLAECSPERVLVFSDDISTCKEVFDRDPKFYYVSERAHERSLISDTHSAERDSEDFIKEDLIELFLMSRCRFNITTNSSYSWWAAWLNNREDRQIFAPSEWFQAEHLKSICDPAKLGAYMDDRIPKSWKRM